LIATQDLAVDLIPGLMAEGEEGQIRLLDRLSYLPGDPMAGVPGYQIRDGNCRVYAEGQTRKDHSWVVRWSAGNPEEVHRSEAASAIEGARRRACLSSYQGILDQVLRDISHASPGDRDGIALGGFESAVESLVVCLTRAQPELGAGLEKPAEAIDGVVECAASRMSMESEWRTVRAWGSSADWTAEMALWELSLMQARRGLAESMSARVRNAPEMQRMGISSGAARLTRLVAASLELEEAGVSCTVLAADSGQELIWKPANVDVAERCGPLQSWMGRNILLQPGTAWNESRYRSCQQLVHQGRSNWAEAIAKAPEGAVVDTALEVWEHLVHCGARCSADVERAPSEGESPLRLSNQPDVWDREQVRQRLQQAIADRDAEQFEICVPALASFRAVMVAQPDRFWGDMTRLEQTGQLYQIFAWESYLGRWYLMPQQ
jgi:hypothetical protein